MIDNPWTRLDGPRFLPPGLRSLRNLIGVNTSRVKEILTQRWTTRRGRFIPDLENVTMDNTAVEINGTCLYADLVDSSDLVANNSPEFAAKIYKAYLGCACRLIRKEGGAITAFDGDRVMAVFKDDANRTHGKETRAVRTAWAISHAVTKILNPEIQAHFRTTYEIRHAVGIDSGPLFVAKTGIRDANDLVWVGNAANRAAKLSGLRVKHYMTYITDAVFSAMASSLTDYVNNEPAWYRLNQSAVPVQAYCSDVYAPLS